jgi:hypothetical protein
MWAFISNMWACISNMWACISNAWDAFWYKKECDCICCTDKNRNGSDLYLKPNMKAAFTSLWVRLNHSFSSNSRYVQGEHVVWIGLSNILIWDSDKKNFTKDSIEIYRVKLLKLLAIFYVYFEPENVKIFADIHNCREYMSVCYRFLANTDPYLFVHWIEHYGHTIRDNLLETARKIIKIDKNCGSLQMWEILFMSHINTKFIYNVGRDGALTSIDDDFGISLPSHGHPGVIITNVKYYNQKKLENLIVNLLSMNIKVRIAKNLEPFFKTMTKVRIVRRHRFGTHLVVKV